MDSLIDSSVIIAVERGQLSSAALAAVDNDPIVLSAVTVSELLHGVFRSTPERRAKRESFVEMILAEARILPFDTRVARVHARISAELAEKGTPSGPHDLIIGATAVAYGLKVVTRNPGDFVKIRDLVVVSI